MYFALGRQQEADTALAKLIEENQDRSAYLIAHVYAARGEADLAFEWLDRAYAQREAMLAQVKTSPRFVSLRDDPRWTAFLEKMGLED